MSKFRNPGKWKGEGPPRANTGFSIRKESISAPIPRIDDDEFPIRTPGASIATPLSSHSPERPPPPRETPLADPRMSGIDVSASHVPAAVDKSSSDASKRSIEDIRQREQPSAVRKSTGSMSRSSIGKPQRKKSSLRSVLGRLFERKRKSSVSPSRKTDSTDLRASQHRSDPSALNRTPLTKTTSPQRSASLPINEYNRALRSHSVILEDFPLRDSYQETPRDSLKAGGSFTRPRGATTPSRLWDQNRIPGYVDWTGLSPRPASSHARGSKAVSDAEAGEVGVAITSSNNSNRRSRSVGELRDVSQHLLARRRSDEIRYWRQSYEQGVLSPISSTKPDVDEEPIVVESAEDEENKENYEPPQPFNFGPMGEMAGMKITQAASLETRVKHLEERVLNVERVVSRLPFSETSQLADPDKRNHSTARPTTGNSEMSLPAHKIHRSSPQRPIRQGQGSQFRSSSYGSSHPSHVSYQPSFESSVDHNPLGTFHPNAPRPLSTSTTIRGGPPSSSPVTKDGNLTTEHYNTLVSLIQTEQSARQNLEDLVQTLQQEVLSLRASLPPPQPHFSTFSNDDSDEDENPGYTNHDDEVFETPMEEPTRAFGDEIFGHVSGNRGVNATRGGGERKSASRTLSLGQITQKQGQSPSTNF